MTDYKEFTNLLDKLGIKYRELESDTHKTLVLIDRWYEEVEYYFDLETGDIKREKEEV